MPVLKEKKYRVTVTTTHKKVYYLDSYDRDTAQDMVEEPYAYGLVEDVDTDLKPDFEEELEEKIEVKQTRR